METVGGYEKLLRGFEMFTVTVFFSVVLFNSIPVGVKGRETNGMSPEEREENLKIETKTPVDWKIRRKQKTFELQLAQGTVGSARHCKKMPHRLVRFCVHLCHGPSL